MNDKVIAGVENLFEDAICAIQILDFQHTVDGRLRQLLAAFNMLAQSSEDVAVASTTRASARAAR